MDRLAALDRSYAACASALDRMVVVDPAARTPCVNWTLGELAGHVVGSAEAFATVLGGGATPAPARVAAARATAGVLRIAARRVVELWADPKILAGEYDRAIQLDDGTLIPPIPLPGEMFLAINLLDVGVHAHDLAVAVGAPELADDDEVALAVLDAAQLVLQPGIRELAGFGPERPTAADAAPRERLLAFVGR